MHCEILNSDQAGLLPIMKLFRKEFYLVGGTAIALQIGHRRSMDFDLFSKKSFGSKRFLNTLEKAGKQPLVTRRVSEQLNLVVDNVKITFFGLFFYFGIASPFPRLFQRRKVFFAKNFPQSCFVHNWLIMRILIIREKWTICLDTKWRMKLYGLF